MNSFIQGAFLADASPIRTVYCLVRVVYSHRRFPVISTGSPAPSQEKCAKFLIALLSHLVIIRNLKLYRSFILLVYVQSFLSFLYGFVYFASFWYLFLKSFHSWKYLHSPQNFAHLRSRILQTLKSWTEFGNIFYTNWDLFWIIVIPQTFAILACLS